MSIHKLTAGSGYDYLTRQVAAQDATEKGHSSLASYYESKGEAPGTWVGAGMAGLDGLQVGDQVTAEQMSNLFGAGRHPLAAALRQAAADAGLSVPEQEGAALLGTPFRVYEHDVSPFRIEVARRVQAFNKARGQRWDAPVPVDERAAIRTEVATEFFRQEFGRDPVDARELAATIAKHTRPRTNAVAGYDLTFSPVKSVSTLWAIADRPTAALIERAHQQAVGDALAFLETNALFTREGTNGVRQVEVRGLIATAFTHRDSRAGDPDLHTHVAVANKVQTRTGGRWLAIDGRVLFAATVAASETYNTALERHLHDALGVRFEARPDQDPRKRPVREIVGVDPALAARWSARRVSIEVRRAELTAAFQATHGRPPSPVESIQLAQQATLETRDAKHEPRALSEQRTTWAAQARQVLGSEQAVSAMVAAVLHPDGTAEQRVDAAWVSATATAIRDTLQTRRSTWRTWHVQAEALRQVRGTSIGTDDVRQVVDLLVDEVLTGRSVPLTRSADPLEPPDVLRRSGGASVYTVAGTDLFTSQELLDAEARIVALAGQVGGPRAPGEVVDLAARASAAEGLALNAGQASLVRQMVTSGARVQLAIAPAGAGKTTAMRALTNAWTSAGGHVLGLAPSAAAATVLGESINSQADTMAKLVWHIDRGDLPEWATAVGPRTLVVIDEAGMADTLSLDKVIGFVVARGGAVRLIGDDQQLASVGAGGVLRDIRATHGALHLSELMRFADPAEGAASLALRDGLPEALGYYLDNNRVHVGDLTTLTDQVFDAWRTDRTDGRDALMLAPTRDLVAELNARARAWRLGGAQPDRTVRLSDTNVASVGDTVITRANDRRLRTTSTDWVKNGDRWQVASVGDDGSLAVQHPTTGRTVHLPAAYVADHVELGYASTIHTAQGTTASTSHTLLAGTESRQLVYTAATRGRTGNHLYVQLVDDGDEHNTIRPDNVRPPTATDLLERILATDDASRSATTTRREAETPTAQLGDAVARYVDSLYVGAEQLLGEQQVARLDVAADQVVPNLTRAAAWPTLRAHLILAATHGQDPLEVLRTAAGARELGSAVDVAAVIDWRLDDTGLRNAGAGPLPWLPGVPAQLGADPQWGPYLAARATEVRRLTTAVADEARTDPTTPTWVTDGRRPPAADLLVDVAVWRAATAVDPGDRRPTGAPQLAKAAARWQDGLDRRLALTHAPALQAWTPLLDQVLHQPGADQFTPVLAERLAALSRAGIDAAHMVRTAAGQGPLPDDHAAAALWWRISRRLNPAVAAQAASDHALTTPWTPRLADLVGNEQATALQTSPWWPALVSVVDHAIAGGMTVDALFTDAAQTSEDLDPCQAMVWRISLLNDPDPTWQAGPEPEPEPEPHRPDPDEPDPFWADPTDDRIPTAPSAEEWATLTPLSPATEPPAADGPAPEPTRPTDGFDDDAFVDAYLQLAAAARADATVLAPTDRQIDTQAARAFDAATAPVSPERILELNTMAADFWAGQLPGSWAQTYLADRVGVDLTGDQHVHPGYAPAGWTNLVDHLRTHGATDDELTAAGLASVARTGRLIDRFRDRLVLPITHPGPDGHLDPLGFVARRHPHAPDDGTAGPKYLNTPDTTLFHKGAQLYVIRHDLLAAGATPVLVEGPLDALAVSLSGQGRYVGAAPLGTSLTDEQALELANAAHRAGAAPLVATDADLAGRMAAQRDYWLLAQHATTPTTIALPPGADPAQLLASTGRQGLLAALGQGSDLADTLLDERLTNLTGPAAVREAADVLAASHPAGWDERVDKIAAATGTPVQVVRRSLARSVRRWEADPRAAADAQVSRLSVVRERVADPERQAAEATRTRKLGPRERLAPTPTSAHVPDAPRP